jgi:ribosomal protein S18 acetylase RimI-like enzyme
MKKAGKSSGSKEHSIAGKVEIREMELHDLPAVFDIGEKSFTPEKRPNLYRTWEEYELLDLFAMDKELCLVAEMDDRIVGFVLGSMIEKERSAWDYGYVEWIGVLPDVKNKGIGTRLFNRLTDLFIKRGARMMLVDTEAENHEALCFFKKQGFGHEIEHIFLSRNLTTHPDYLKKKKAERELSKSKGIRKSNENS